MKIEYTPERGRVFVRPGETEKQQNWGFSGITKSAQLPERLCERLTCCTKNKYEHWNYINCVKKRHNCRITGKKNATYDGRKNMIYMLITLCIDNDATFWAGWQICHQGGQQRHDLIFLGQFLRKSSRANLFGLASCSWSGISFISLNFFSTCLSSMDNAISRNSSLFIVYSCKEMRRSSSHHGADSFYPLGSMPRCCNSLRIIRFIQAARESSPSCCCAFSIFSRKSGSKRNWNGGLPRLSFLCIDTLITPHVMYLCVMTHYTQSTQKAKPRTVGAVTGLLTNNVN